MTRSILLLGGSQQQVIAIETAKRLGFRTVLCDYLEDNPGQFSADKFYLVSTTDRDAVLQVALKEKVNGVLAYASDPAAPTAAYVAEKLGLPTNPLRAVETMSEKHLFRAHLRKNGLPCPRSVTIEVSSDCSESMDRIRDLSYPVVVKPTDSSGSKGVSVVEEISLVEDAVRHAAEFGRNGCVIVEEYIERTFPHVIGGDIFVVNGEIKFWGLMSCLRDPERDLVPAGEFSPCGLNERQYTEVQNTLRNLVSSLGLCFGELNVEIIIGRNDVPYVLELGARAGGNMIPIQLSDASGIDLVEANILCAMGLSPDRIDFVLDDEACATYVLHSMEAGRLEGIDIAQELKPFVYRVSMYAKPNEPIDCFDGANKAIGIVFLKFKDAIQMTNYLHQLGRLVQIRLSRG